MALGKADTPHILDKAINGTEDGTYFTADENLAPLNYKKQWIAFHSGPKGEIVVQKNHRSTSCTARKALIPMALSM